MAAYDTTASFEISDVLNTSMSNKLLFLKPLSCAPIPENKILAVNFTFSFKLFLLLEVKKENN